MICAVLVTRKIKMKTDGGGCAIASKLIMEIMTVALVDRKSIVLEKNNRPFICIKE